jgi:Ser/Thr protein kinase RdoA (MazF antagonist)
MAMPRESAEIDRALAAFPGLGRAAAEPLAGGLIHQSFCVPHGEAEYVLQRVSPIFSPRIHENIRAVTEHLLARGFPSFRLLPTRDGKPYADLGPAGIWRLMTRVPGVAFDTCSSPEQAHSAAALVARFHSALADLDHDFQPLGIPFHDTATYLEELARALVQHREHRLFPVVAPLAQQILDASACQQPLEGVPLRVVHGDLKFNNVLFAGEHGADKQTAQSLIDLDTVSRMPLWVELGDAWRSWCNRAGEDTAEAELDLALFRASVEGYLGALSIEFDARERASLAHGLERVSLELASRFAADALCESYFGWDPERFASAGDHSLTRARGQLSLYRQARDTRAAQLRALGA